MMPHTSTAASRRAAIVSIGIKWALVLLVILNLLQLNLLYFSSNGSTRCILKAALATRARTGDPAAPPAAPVLPGSPLGSYEQLGNPVVGIYAPVLQHAGKEAFLLQVTRLQKTSSGRYALFVIYAWNYEVLLTAVRSFAAAGFGKSLIILDNTSNSTLLGDPVIAELAAEVIPARTRLTFSQAQNFIADVAIERGYEYYFWGHSDVAVLGKDESASFADDVIACVEASFKSRPNWGIIYFNYDWFSAIRTDLVRQVKYDTFVTVYMSDCDFYPRVRAAGFETLNYPQMCPSTKVEVYDINRPLDIPWNDFDRAKAILENHRVSEGNRFEWKMNAMVTGEKAGWDLWGRSSYLYFLAKWGPRQEGQSHCAVEVKEPITGNMTLPQQPFGNLGYLQRFWVQEDPFFDRLPILAGLGRPVEAEYYGAAAAPKAAASQSAGSLSRDELSMLQHADDAEIITESDNGLEQIQAAYAGAAASQLASAASEALSQPADSKPQQAPGTAKQEGLRGKRADEAEENIAGTRQESSLDALDEDLASHDQLADEKLAAESDQVFLRPDADNEQDQGALDLDAEIEQDGQPDEEGQADTGAADLADDSSLAEEDTAADQQMDSGKGIQEATSREKAATRDQPTVTFLGNDVAISENAEELYPEETKAGVWDSLHQDSDSEAEEESSSEAGQDSSDGKDASQTEASLGSLAADKTEPDRQQGPSRLGEADAEQELDAEPEEDMGDDGRLDSEDVDSPGQDESYSKRYYSGGILSREQADDEDYDAEYADQPDDAEYADQPEDDEYADQADEDTLEQDYTDLPEGSEAGEDLPDSSPEAEEIVGSEATDRGSGTPRVKAGAQGKTRSRGAEVADSAERAVPSRHEDAGKRAEDNSGRVQEDASAAADSDGVAADEDAAAPDEDLEAAEVDVGPVDEQGLEEWDGEEEFSDPADLGLDELDIGDELDDEWGLEDPDSTEGEVDGGDDADLLDEGSADQKEV